MLDRKAFRLLEKWRLTPNHKPLIIQGARQVGKTFAVRTFAKTHFACFYELNFVRSPGLKEIFKGAMDADTLLSSIRLNFPSIHFEAGNTLIFLDELQDCPEAATALKFLSNDLRFDVIASGSALGMIHASVASWPVGHVEYLDMTALDFEEFLWASGMERDLIQNLSAYMDGKRKIPEAIHQTLMHHLRQYLVIGGMPDVVNAFMQGQDYVLADEVQRRIWRDYLADIAHYAEPQMRLNAQRCWQSIPAQLSKENHKFQYEIVEHKGTARKFASSVDWLTASGMACKVYNISTAEYPLNAFTILDQFRIYPNDIGLLICTYDFSLKRTLTVDESSLDQTESIIVRTAKGGIYEALAADFLQKRGYTDLHFYRNTSGTVEVEFLIENRHGAIPIEIKAGHNKTRSLDLLLEDPNIAYGYKFSDQNAGSSGKKITLPLYMMMFL